MALFLKNKFHKLRDKGFYPINTLIAIVIFALMLMAVPVTGVQAGVLDTVHNMGFYSPGTVKSPDTTQVCIFCHTPHSAASAGPIWNKNESGATYTLYTTETMVSNVGQPTGSSKLCLSCHDGTIALGSLLNLPGAATTGNIDVLNTTAGKLSSSSTAYIGTDLSDDHPVSFAYSDSIDNIEIQDKASLPEAINLDSAGRLQCTTCHDPHGTAYDNFLVASLATGGLCTDCHLKRYWDGDTPIHDTSTLVWDETGTNPWHEDFGVAGYGDDTPAMHKCLSCHRSHGGAATMTILKGVNPSDSSEVAEEWTCLACHNGTMAADMETYFTMVSSHPVMDVAKYGKHQPSRVIAGDPAREDAANLDKADRHAECADCHNPHGAKSGNHTVGGAYGYEIGPNLLGGWGVRPSTAWPDNGVGGDNRLTSFIEDDFDSETPGHVSRLEGYMCIKCHSSYAYGTTVTDRWDVPSGNADGSAVIEADITGDMNPNNLGIHPVFGVGKNIPPTNANTFWGSGNNLTETFMYAEYTGGEVDRAGFDNVAHTSTISCSDCHGSDVKTDLKGPHGSETEWILRSNETGVGSTKTFCYNCHRRDVYGDEGYVDSTNDYRAPRMSRVLHPPDLDPNSNFYKAGAGTGNDSNHFGILCLTCHGGGWNGSAYWEEAQLPTNIYENTMSGIHGSNHDENTSVSGDDPLGYRLMNGACVKSYTRPSTSAAGTITFRSVTPGTDKVCNKDLSGSSLNIPTTSVQYDCGDVTDCNSTN